MNDIFQYLFWISGFYALCVVLDVPLDQMGSHIICLIFGDSNSDTNIQG